MIFLQPWITLMFTRVYRDGYQNAIKMPVIFHCEYSVTYQLLKCVNCSILWGGWINITRSTIYLFIHILSFQQNITHGENNCVTVSCKTSSCFETLNGPVSLSTVLTQITMNLSETLNFNSFGITCMAQFVSYIMNQLYQQRTWGPFSIGVHIL